jgi:biotin synthase
MIKKNILKTIEKKYLEKEDIVALLQLNKDDSELLFKKTGEIKQKYVGNKVYLRGLIEYSNICVKDCYYCGIRKSNASLERYTILDEEVLEAVKFAYTEKYSSLVLQSGEISTQKYIASVTNLLCKIREITNNEMSITLSLGEQNKETLLEWKNAGAKRYLLRIETSNPELYKKIHPNNAHHNFQQRIEFIKLLREINYQVGTGVMIGLPFQTIDDLADDLIFFRENDIDMIGMGPYLEHQDTPLYKYKNLLLSQSERFELSLKMIAILRIMMKDINIAATTAMQTLEERGREKALIAGANVVMPNITPLKYRKNYLLYDNKVCVEEAAIKCKKCIEGRIKFAGGEIAFGEYGDSPHFQNRQ